MIIIRQETPYSQEAIYLLEKSCEYIANNCPDDFNHTYELSILASNQARFFIVRNGGLAVGCGSYVHLDEETVEIRHIYVDDSARGLGLGKRLLTYIESIAKRNNIKKIMLETNTTLVAACDLYIKYGYIVCDPYIDIYSETDIFMSKNI